MNYKNRIKVLRELFTPNYDALLVTNLSNVRYLCGYSGSNGTLLISRKEAFFFTDFRYKEQSAKEVGDTAEIIVLQAGHEKDMFEKIKEICPNGIAVEKSMSLGKFLDLGKHYDKSIVPTEGLVEEGRGCKDSDEAILLHKAFDIADKAIDKIFKEIRPGMTELEVAGKLEYYMKSLGSSMPSFDTIVAAGSNASCPHHEPTEKVIQKGEMVKIDFGATYGGYHSDMTRTVFMGEATSKFKEIYSIVANAQKATIEACKVGQVCNDIHNLAVKIISDAGYGEYFGHGLGHSVGLDIHEKPSLSQTCKSVIKAGNVFTFEPGIYIPGWGGVRIEDVYMVKENGLERFTMTLNDLLEIKC